ncbi:Hypothetical protein FKW44_014874 [Caligus rogercresseyi]|uniref:Uncharacterized protein n=1 Tax=Caligus rogercresseyi TaxID=217165 RepID=A0A7T8GZK8_CALRO|nr:Hypothetical protein FKW44_014874 [Caligus rogercresseyi]
MSVSNEAVENVVPMETGPSAKGVVPVGKNTNSLSTNSDDCFGPGPIKCPSERFTMPWECVLHQPCTRKIEF